MLLPVRSEAPYGHRRYLPIFEAADRHNLNVGPSCKFVAMAMQFKLMMVAAAQRHGKFLADLATEPCVIACKA